MTAFADSIYFLPAFASLSTLATALGLYHINRRMRMHARLRKAKDAVSDQVKADASLYEQPLPVLWKVIGFLGVLLPGHIYSDTLRLELVQAGLHHRDARRAFAGVRVLTTAGLGVGNFVLASSFGLQHSEIFLVTAVAIGVGYLMPQMFLRWKQDKRKEELTLTLPDALDLLVICVEAGQALNAAILNVGREIEFTAPALSRELSLVNHEMRAGVTRTQALRNLALRTGVDDVRALVAVLIQSDRFGTSVAQALRIHAQSLRTRRRQRAEEAARKAPVKLVFPLVFCIFPELMVVILAPGMLEMFRALADMAQG
jgi:tight adherence protein C